MKKDNRASIKLSQENADKLKSLKLNGYESYNSLIHRVCKDYCKNNPKAKSCKRRLPNKK